MPMLPTIEEEDKLSWLRLMWRYRLQYQAMLSASVIFIAGGMKLAWSIFETPTGKFLSNTSTHQLTISWFLGVIVGAALAATFVQRVTKHVAHCASGALLLFGGIVFITFPTHLLALICSCLCEGCAFGLTQVQAFVTGGELAHKNIRGLLLSLERISLWFGICLQLLYTRLWYTLEPAAGHVMHVNQIHGIVVAFLGLIAIVFTLIYRIESPLLLQLQHRDLAVTQVLKLLEGSSYPNTELLRMREDCKHLLAYDAEQGAWAAFKQHNALPLLKLIILRCFIALSLSSLPFNHAFLTVSWGGFGCEMNCIYVLALCGLFGSIIGGLLIDEHGRRKISVVSLLLSVIFICIAGGIFKDFETTRRAFYSLELEMAACLMLLYQLVISAGVSVATSVYAAEAFTTIVKSKCLAVMIASEQLLAIALAVLAFQLDFDYSTYFFVTGSFGLVLGLFVFFFMPETKYLPLSECLIKFKKFP